MFKFISVPFGALIQAFVAIMQSVHTSANAINNLADAAESVTGVAKDAAETWAKEEAAVNASKLDHLHKRIAHAKESGIEFKRQDDGEIQL